MTTWTEATAGMTEDQRMRLDLIGYRGALQRFLWYRRRFAMSIDAALDATEAWATNRSDQALRRVSHGTGAT